MCFYESEASGKSLATGVERSEFSLRSPFKRITLADAFASARRQLEEAEDERRKVAEAQSRFIGGLMDVLEED
ncbi:MAG TPA: hypothetical protein VM163_04495 [bacterium]|nr:hypothetical protein [bacterium]